MYFFSGPKQRKSVPQIEVDDSDIKGTYAHNCTACMYNIVALALLWFQ